MCEAERTAELLERRARVLGRGYRLFYEEPVELVRGEGVRVFDREGNRYLDAYNNVPVVGHCNPEVVAAIQSQAATLNTNTRYLAEPILEYAERLLATHGDGLERMMFACSGSEAVDLAIRLARHATGAEGVIVTENAYHGATVASAGASPDLGAGSPAPPWRRTVAAPDPRGGEDGQAFATRVETAIESLRRDGHGLAAMIVDTAFVSDGVVMDPPNFLGPAVATIQAAGGLFVADEVQAGFGRSGTDLWCYQRHGIEPDLVTLGKPMGNGLPIAALVARPDLMDSFGDAVRYFNTFGGNSVSVAAASAVLEIIERDDLPANALTVGDHIRHGLRQIAANHEIVADVRGDGLFIAADILDPATGSPSRRLADAIVNGLRLRHVLIGSVGPDRTTLKIRPPLPIKETEADELIEHLATTVAGVGRGSQVAQSSPR